MNTKQILLFTLFFVVAPICLAIRWPLGALEVVAGALISMWVTVMLSILLKPALKIELYQPGAPEDGRFRAGQHLGYVRQLRLVNKELPGWLRFLQRNTATDVRASLIFRSLNGATVLGPMPARWSNTPQLDKVIIERAQNAPPVTKIITDPERLVATQQIPPGFLENGVFAVAARFDNDTDAFGVTNECYYTDWHPPSWKLGQGTYRVEVRIDAQNASCEGEFLLTNSGELPCGFRLENVPAELRGKTK